MHRPNMIGKDFPSLAQRVLYPILCSYPEFRPVASPEASEESQRQMHAFLWEIISGLYAHPEILGIAAVPDDAYEGWQLNNHRPELIKLMRKTLKPAVDFYTLLLALGAHGVVEEAGLRVSTADVKPKKAQLRALASFGVDSQVEEGSLLLRSDKYPAVLAAWRLLSRTSAQQGARDEEFPGQGARIALFLFSHCIFDPPLDYVLPVLASLDPASAESIAGLDRYLHDGGYAKRVFQEGTEMWGVSYSKDGERRFNIQSDGRKRIQMNYILRLNQFRHFWERFAEAGANAQQLLIEMTRPCSGCGNCKKINIKTMGPFTTDVTGEERTLCPWYPDSQWWGHLTDAQIDGIRDLLEMQERILQGDR